jgi:hypothetical protein
VSVDRPNSLARRGGSLRRTFWLAALAASLVGCEPRDATPGLRMGGSPADIPADFGFVRDYDEMYIETRFSVLPYVVNLWGVGSGDHMYMWCTPDQYWCSNVIKKPDVRVRVGDSVYEMRATSVTDGPHFAEAIRLYMEKYGEQLEEFDEPLTPEFFGHFFRLTPRV